MMDFFVGPFQFSFIKRRQILDGALVIGEIDDSCKKKMEAVILKLGFHKAFDIVSWICIDL